MNWGNKLVVVFIVFAALMATLVYKATQTKFELVSKDYYQDELRYQDKIDGAANASRQLPLSVFIKDGQVHIKFPMAEKNKEITGEAWFYCATDAYKDKRVALSVDPNGLETIELKRFIKGSYVVKISYEIAGKKYYAEHQLVIQ
jgi:hypothetical protein